MANRIFKYFTINEFLYKSLTNNELYFSSPRNFNDPYDSKAIYLLTSDKTQVEQLFNYIKLEINDRLNNKVKTAEFIKKTQQWNLVLSTFIDAKIGFGKVYKNNEYSIDDKTIELHSFYNYSNIFEHCYSANQLELQQKMFEDLTFLIVDYEKYGITCGSTSSTCSVMWGHYANNHRGICLEIEISDKKGKQNLIQNEKDFFKVMNVDYTDTPINMYDFEALNNKKIRTQLLSTKSKTWHYENEVRIIAKNQGCIPINRYNVKSIIFGSKSSPADRLTFCRLLAALDYKIELKIARLQVDSYDMKIENMEVNDIVGTHIKDHEISLMGYDPKEILNR